METKVANHVPGSTSTDFRFLSGLEQWYIDCCRRHAVPLNKALLAAFFKADVKKSSSQLCSLVVSLDDLKDADFLPLLEIFMKIDYSEIDAVDILHDSSCDLNWKYVLLLLRAINQKLRVVDLRNFSFGKEFLRDLSQRGLTSQVLNLRSSHFRKLNMVGKFRQLHTLNLDFSSSLTSFREDCFTCMLNLKCLSLCETRIANLWTNSSALSKLPSLAELRFQICLYCDNQGPASSGEKTTNLVCLNSDFSTEQIPFEENYNPYLVLEQAYIDDNIHAEDSSDDSEMDFSNSHRQQLFFEALSGATRWNGLADLQNEISGGMLVMQDEEKSLTSLISRDISQIPNKYISYHPSPICYKRHYREFMVASLPGLRVLDNLPISKIDREIANINFSDHFEYLPYRRKNKESVTNILQNREIRGYITLSENRRQKPFHVTTKSQLFYSSVSGNGSSRFRARQFEYHPSDSSLMAFGTLDGEVVVINHESEKLVSYIPSLGAMNCVLGLCWLKKYPSKLIAGSDNGSLKLYDIKHNSSINGGLHYRAHSVTFEDFDQLTSVHINSTDELFLASGYSKDVALYDISSGRRLQVFTDMHREHINVVKFANHSPSIFATSSFDHDVKMWDLRQKPISPCYTAPSSRGNVMACFSPDDHYLLVSAVDNEVRQLLAADGRLHLNFNIGLTGSSQNYTRSYYMNGRDYIISGSCDENVVRICCTQTGRRLRDISLEGNGAGASMFVQSLRGDPFRDFNMSILAAYIRPSSNSEIVKVNLLASSNSTKDYLDDLHSCSSYSMGG